MKSTPKYRRYKAHPTYLPTGRNRRVRALRGVMTTQQRRILVGVGIRSLANR